jgi:hypothetical protein
MAPSLLNGDGSGDSIYLSGSARKSYSMLAETHKALEKLLQLANNQLPSECIELITAAEFTTSNPGTPDFPCPVKETEAAGALKAVEAGVAAAIANLRLGEQKRKIVVDLERASCFLFSAYVAAVGGYEKGNPKSRALLKGEQPVGSVFARQLD